MTVNAFLVAAWAVIALAALIAALRWSCAPMKIAYRTGVAMGLHARAEGKPAVVAPGYLLEAVMAFLMPLPAARIMREQRRNMRLLVLTLNYGVNGNAGPVRSAARRPAGWYHLPLPLAALVALLRPLYVVRQARSAGRALTWICDAMMQQEQRSKTAAGRRQGAAR